MHGLFAVLGPAAESVSDAQVREWCSAPDSGELRAERFGGDVLLALLGANSAKRHVGVTHERGAFHYALDGYIIGEPALGSQADELLRFARAAAHDGLVQSISQLRAGSFNIAEIADGGSSIRIVNDNMASIPLYIGRCDSSCVIATNPISIARSGLVSTEPDLVALAEMAFVGYPLAGRHFYRSVRHVPAGSIIKWDRARRELTVGSGCGDILREPRTAESPTASEIAERFSAACRRVQALPGQTGHFQSAGMDSRLIFAECAREQPPPCFTYGSEASVEVEIAEDVARTGGAVFSHLAPNGDQLADHLDAVFSAYGSVVYPDRYLGAKVMAEQGLQNVLDGFVGDVFLGGLFYSNDRYFSKRSRVQRFLTSYADQRISDHSLDAIAQALWSDIELPGTRSLLADFVDNDLREEILDQRKLIVDDVRREVEDWVDVSDNSVGLLFRNFKVANRSRRGILRQAVMSRQFLQVLMPFANDVEFTRTALRIPPRSAAYRRFYIGLFRKHYPAFGQLRCGDSLLPLYSGPLRHKLSSILLSKGKEVPVLSGRTGGKLLDFNNWSRWLLESPRLRAKVADYFEMGDGGSPARASLANIGAGKKSGSGRVLHLASVVRWRRGAV